MTAVLRVTQQNNLNVCWSTGALASEPHSLDAPPPPLPYTQCRLGEPRKERVPKSPGCQDAGLSMPGGGFNVGGVWWALSKFSHVETRAAACGWGWHLCTKPPSDYLSAHCYPWNAVPPPL